MARSAITVRTLTSPRGGLNAVPGTHFDAADAANDHEFAHPGGIALLYIENNSGATMNVVITAVAAASTKLMAEDITRAVLDGSRLLEPIKHNDGYIGADGNVDIDIDQDTSSYLAVFKLAG